MPNFNRPFAIYFPDEEDAPLCDHCGHPLEGEADVDIADETGRTYISGWSAVCNNPDRPD